MGTVDQTPLPGSGLADAEAFEGDHLSEAALVLVADGASALLGERARAHAESCATCAACVAEQALSASELHSAFDALGSVQRELLVASAERELSRNESGVRRPIGLTSPKGWSNEGEKRDGAAAGDSALVAEPESGRRRARGGGWWITGGLLVAALASAPSLSGLAKGISEVREALLVVIAVSIQAEQALRVASGRLEVMRTTASWLAAIAMVMVGLWIARRDPKRGVANVTKEVEGTR